MEVRLSAKRLDLKPLGQRLILAMWFAGGLRFAPPALAQNHPNSAPPPSATISLLSTATAEGQSSPPSPDPTQSAEPPATMPNQFPWLWLAIGTLGFWNAALTFWVLSNSTKIGQLNGRFGGLHQKQKELEKRSVEVHERVSRRDSANEVEPLKKELADHRRELADHKQKLETLQSHSSLGQGYAGYSPAVQTPGYSPPPPNFPMSGQQDRQGGYQVFPVPVHEPWEGIAHSYNAAAGNSSASGLEAQIVERVSETEASVSGRRRNSKAIVSLKCSNNPSYWVLVGDDRTYWLTPKSDLKITPMGFDTLQALFDCPEYQQGYRLHLLKPARVAQSPSGNWELLEKGQVQFVA